MFHLRFKQRTFRLLMGIFFSWLLLWGRLFWIQIASEEHFGPHDVDLTFHAVQQRKVGAVFDSGRGDITDRNGVPLTGEIKHVIYLFPKIEDENKQDRDLNLRIKVFEKLTGTSYGSISKMIDKAVSPIPLTKEDGSLFTINDKVKSEINKLHIPGIVSISVIDRYQFNGMARHLIGYIGQNPELVKRKYGAEIIQGWITPDTPVGVAGLEYSFQPFLKGMGSSSLSYFVDGQGRPLFGLDGGIKKSSNPFYPLSVVTTIDSVIQRVVEKEMDRLGITDGAAVILDASTREVLAMASRPNFNPNQVDPKSDTWQNKGIKQTSPGSVFKIVVAAAALDTGTFSLNDRFFCNGSYGKYNFTCWKKEGHGWLTLAEAFAQSCNVTFAQVAYRLGGKTIEEYAEKLGVTTPVGWEDADFFHKGEFTQLAGEEAGQIFADSTPKDDEGVLIQTAIGQRDVQITPLQAANMVASILDRGRKEEVRVVKEIRYQNGVSFYTFSGKKIKGESITPYTAYQLQKMMQLVVEEGTATSLKNSLISVAGKTGTAQVFIRNRERNNQWFVGYGPTEKPKYVMAVVAKNRNPQSSNAAVHLFHRIMDEIAR
ncbi:penicillin-binding protein 2 [Microaerobacter geothermalis]|uniref:peptidoglycan D,D-transpeptidase FtsI family protein n=1 Tax=Microaerobacter geothermalis TaxID=674972 RepID=UPI001F28B626|nr:penicillin-binding protein 2 [Microaerobacter geothermalis]MCF6094000.1 penicillin-binding protein 2 [Microaerobacter geothermalis]